jgi:hypothetical protein
MARTEFHLACDLIRVHGQRNGTGAKHRPRGHVPEPYTSLPAAVFMLTCAARLVMQASKHMGIRGGVNGNIPLGLGGRELVSASAAAGTPLLGRARVTPRRTGIHPWRLLEGADLDGYLGDARSLQNRLAHSGTTDGAVLRSPFFVKNGRSAQLFVKNGRSALPRMTLMLAEGLLQAAQDVAYLALKAAGPPAFPLTDCWEWVLPRQSGMGAMSVRLWRYEAFPLDEQPDG